MKTVQGLSFTDLGNRGPAFATGNWYWKGVLTGNFNMQHPFPPDPEALPLCLDHDASFSFNDPAFYVSYSQHPSLLLDNRISNLTYQSPYVPTHLFHHPIVTADELVVPLYNSGFPPLTPILASSFYSQQSLQASPERNHVCNEPGCTWRSSFKTKNGLTRHREVMHLQKRNDCPIPGCSRVGKKGIKRKDNLRTHVRVRHGVELPRGPARARSIGNRVPFPPWPCWFSIAAIPSTWWLGWAFLGCLCWSIHFSFFRPSPLPYFLCLLKLSHYLILLFLCFPRHLYSVITTPMDPMVDYFSISSSFCPQVSPKSSCRFHSCLFTFCFLGIFICYEQICLREPLPFSLMTFHLALCTDSAS